MKYPLLPASLREQKERLDEVLVMNTGIDRGLTLAYLRSLDEQAAAVVARGLASREYVAFAENVKEYAARQVVRSRVNELVRKKKGGGGFVLYAPNKGKKKAAKPTGDFPTKLGAKKAELSRFPPKDPEKLQRLRHEVDKLLKDPAKRAEKERQAAHTAGTAETQKPAQKKAKSEGVLREALSRDIRRHVSEALFREDAPPESGWQDVVSKLSKKALAGDKKFQKLQDNIKAKTEKALEAAYKAVSRAVDKSQVKLKPGGMKAEPASGRPYFSFSATIGNVSVEPIGIYVDGGALKVEFSDHAKAALTKVDPAASRLFRADIVQVQERVLDKMDEPRSSVESRDRYLEKLEKGVDDFVSGLSPLQVTLLKHLLVMKYRKV